MTIEVSPEPEGGVAVEACCFCRKRTKYWYVPHDVACCQSCAKRAIPEDVPTKALWWRREVVATGVGG